MAQTRVDVQPLIDRAVEAYKRGLVARKPGLVWDYLVLTAANEHQAAGYRHELSARCSGVGPHGSFFSSSQHFLVVPDPPGIRAGSGGATFNVLREIIAHQKQLKDRRPLEQLRILLIHSGGASQRLPMYSPLGKIFSPLPLQRPDGALSSLFDHLYLMLAPLPEKLGPGMLVAAGDVFLLFDGAAMPAGAHGITALSMRVPAAMGEAHGIFCVDPSDRSPMPRVTACMQKASVEQMQAAGATDAKNQVLIDTGLLFFDGATTRGLLQLAKRYDARWQLKHRQQIDLYSDVVPAATNPGPSSGKRPSAGHPKGQLEFDLRTALAKVPLTMYALAEAHFLHLGTTAQFRDAMVQVDRAVAAQLFDTNVRALSERKTPAQSRLFQALLEGPVKVGPQCVLENVQLAGPLEIGKGSVLSRVVFQTTAPLTLAAETLLFTTPLREGKKRYCALVLAGVHDDFKSDRTYCHVDLRHWMLLAGVSDEDLWPAGLAHRTLWTARLFPALPWGVEVAPELPLASYLWMTNPRDAKPAQLKAWLSGKRVSMADILELADADEMHQQRDRIAGRLQARQWIQAVAKGVTISSAMAVDHFSLPGYRELVTELSAAAQDPQRPALQRARLHWSLHEIQQRPGFPKALHSLIPPGASFDASFAAISTAMTPTATAIKPARLQSFKTIIAKAPARLDLTGGWSDTPPYCLEHGGAVINLAVDLNGDQPISASVCAIEDPVLRLISRDLGKSVELRSPEQFPAQVDPRDPFALHLTALRLTGLAPQPKETSAKAWFKRMGLTAGGFELITDSSLPKGSGMGTSSILGAATLAVLRKAVGLDTKLESIYEQTSLLEQWLSTGGGWQDQVGGIAPGVKLTRSEPGIPQKLQVQKLAVKDSILKGLQSRLVVYFTGQQRLARNILREVMGRYLGRDPATMVLFAELQQSVVALEKFLQRGNWVGVAGELNHYWRIKKELFPGSSTSAIDALLLELRPYYIGASLSGAGGGGFAFFLCESPEQAHRLRTELHRMSMRPGSLGLSFTVTINQEGLTIRSQN